MAKKLDKKDVNNAFWFWWVCSHMTYNYQRLQAGAMAGMMGPVLDKVYEGDQTKVTEGLKRQMMYFNTEPRWGAILPGMVVALEEGMANNPETADPNTIIEIKTALMGPLAGIGDTVWAGLMKPIILSIILPYAMAGSIAAAWVYGAGVTWLDWFVTRSMFMRGYKLGINSVDKFLEGGYVKKITTFLGIVGMFCLGAMVVKYVTAKVVYSLTISTGSIDIGALVNKIVPSLVGLLITLFAFNLQNKGKSITYVLLMLFIIGFVGGAIGFLG